jgi:hypothetical protein
MEGYKNDPTVENLEKKTKVIRDWFRLVLWYVRLRKCCRVSRDDRLGKKGNYGKELLEVNSRYLLQTAKNEYNKKDKSVTEANIKTFLEENKKATNRPSGTVKDRNLNTPDDEDDDDDEFDDFKEEVEETKEFIANEAEKLAMSMDISHFVNDIKL